MTGGNSMPSHPHSARGMLKQQATPQEAPLQIRGKERSHGGIQLGPLLCWAVVLLTLKYAEVTHRFPQGGGVVTVAAQAINHWVGALGGMFILVDYFLTAAISCVSGVIYFSVVVPAIGPRFLEVTIGILILLGILNWIGISESAKVSLVGAVIAFVSDLAILFTVFAHISFAEFLSLFPAMFVHQKITPVYLLTGFAASFLAFSGLESISQLSPVMKTPRKKVAGMALLLVVLTIGITSPLLTMLSTLLQPHEANDPVLSNQLISLLGGHWGNVFLQTEMAISASALLVFASNTAIIGSYHVFMALSRMEFFPAFVLKRNKLRGTPHYSIALATGIPIAILIVARGSLDLLGNLYAFGLLGAFTLTCLGLDLVRYRERKAARARTYTLPAVNQENGNGSLPPGRVLDASFVINNERVSSNGGTPGRVTLPGKSEVAATARRSEVLSLWSTINLYLGILTTALVMLAWSTNLVSKHLATEFGGAVVTTGMAVAYLNYRYNKRKGRVPVTITGVEGRLPGSVLAVLTTGNGHNDAVIRAAVNNAHGHPIVFLYLSENKAKAGRAPTMFEVVDPYLDDQQAKDYFGKAENLAQKAKIPRRYVYRQQEPDVVARVWQAVHPHDTVVAAENASQFEDINPDRIRYELTSKGKVAHMLKQW